MVGSLTGAVTSQRVTEVYKGKLKLDFNINCRAQWYKLA